MSRALGDWDVALDNASAVIHLAAETGTAQSMYEISRYTETNIGGTAALLNHLANRKHNVSKIILASSRSVYGEGAYRCKHCGLVYPPARSETMFRWPSGSRGVPAANAKLRLRQHWKKQKQRPRRFTP